MFKNIPHPIYSSELVKHTDILHDLILKYNTKKLHHAYIFSGIKGIGKTTLAYIFSKLILSNNAINYSHFKPIVNTTDISLITNKSNPNLLVIEPEYDEKLEQYKNTITIEQTRNIKTFLNSTSLTSDIYPKIVIIDAIDNLNINAANSILKILEEPSNNRIFLLICHNLSNVLPTILSRCIIKHFNALNSEEIYKILKILNINVDKLIDINNLNFNEGSIQDIIWFLDHNNYNAFKLANEIIKNQDICRIHLLIDSIKNLSTYDFRYFIEAITPKDIRQPYQINSLYYNIKLLLDQDKSFNLDKSTILTSYILDLIK